MKTIRAAFTLGLFISVTACGSGKAVVDRGPIESGEIETWAGDGTQGHDGNGHPRLESWLNQPMEMEFAADGTALVVDWNNHCVRRVRTDDTLEDVIGTPMPGDWPCQTPGDATACEVPLSGSVPGTELPLNHPMDVLFGDGGAFYLAAWHNHKIELFDAASKAVSIVAGLQKPGGDGDGGPGAAARLAFPSSIVVASDGALLVGDEKNNRVRRIANDAERTMTTIAGAMTPDAAVPDDGVPATKALFALGPADESSGADNPPPGGALALDADGNLYVSDTFRHCVRRIAPGPDGVVDGIDGADETITTIAGTCGESGYSGDGGPAANAKLHRPFDLEIGPDGALYVADTANHAVRRVDLAKGTIHTIAGNGRPGMDGDGGPATEALLRFPYGLAFDAEGSLFVLDTMNDRIRRIAR